MCGGKTFISTSVYNNFMRLHKGMTNLEIAELFRALAASYQLKNPDENKFRIIAYERAADAVEHLSSEAKDLWDEGKLDDIPGVGTSMTEDLGELFKTGSSKHFEDILKGIPSSVFEIMELPRVGAKTASKLVKYLNLGKSKKPIEDLARACKEGKVAIIEGFGEESQKDILLAIVEMRRQVKRHLLPYALNIANEVIAWLKEDKSVIQVDVLGSLRRMASTIGDIDISVATNSPQDVLRRFTEYPKTTRVIEKGEKTASILLPGGIQVDLMVTTPWSYGSLLQHFTGSKHHNIALRELAIKKEMSLSEYGIKVRKQKQLKRFVDEKSFYSFLSLDYIPPELREDAGEIEAAQEGKLPNLVEIGNIKGDLQMHSSFNIETSHDNGESTMEELIEKANSLGYEYIAFTEHNPSRSQHNEQQILDLLKRKQEVVEKLNYSLVKDVKTGVKKVFNSLEIDILPDGRLPIPEKSFDFIDFALVSIHSSFRQSKNDATKRVINGLSYPKAKVFAHPSGRKLNEREGVEMDWPEIFAFCLKNHKYLEINADPIRLDLPDFLVREAVKMGIKLSLGTDAHHQDGLDNMPWGISVARRGWARASDIINTRTLEEFEKIILERG